MNKGIGALIFGLLALVGGLAFVAILVKNKLSKEKEFEETDDDDFDLTVDDEEFEHFFGDDDDEMFPDDKIASDDDNDDIQVEVIAKETPVVSSDFEESVVNSDANDDAANPFDTLDETDFPKPVSANDELPKADTSISDIDDEDLMGITDEDIEKEEEQL